uniref:Uncharacterized protein n=1 Tax=Arundo donax TaxID=35708 RepID=A0A0A9NH74_ARUDO
MAPPPRRR